MSKYSYERIKPKDLKERIRNAMNPDSGNFSILCDGKIVKNLFNWARNYISSLVETLNEEIE